MLNCGDHAGLLREEEEEGLSAFSPKTCACLVATPCFTNASLWLASRGLMLAFIAAAASAETRCEGIPAGVACALTNSQSVTADLTIGEVKTYKLVLEVNVCSDPTR